MGSLPPLPFPLWDCCWHSWGSLGVAQGGPCRAGAVPGCPFAFLHCPSLGCRSRGSREISTACLCLSLPITITELQLDLQSGADNSGISQVLPPRGGTGKSDRAARLLTDVLTMEQCCPGKGRILLWEGSDPLPERGRGVPDAE